MEFSQLEVLTHISRDRCVANLKKLHPTTKYKADAAVLVQMCLINDEVCLLYTKRSMNLKSHCGQISFPGGKTDGNETVVETALRETHEEIGVSPQDVDVWGIMAPVPGQRNMQIVPVVAEIENFNMDTLVRNSDEVDEIFTVPLSALCDPENHAYQDCIPPAPVYLYAKHYIWGITGCITHSFLQSLLSDNVYKFDFTRRKFTESELMDAI